MTAKLKMTPMLQQYLEIKEQHADAILFYRMGDFYEMFFDDAQTAARVLGITLTSRSSKEAENKIPMCGVPHHAVSAYLVKLVKAGFRVAICEQVEDPRQAKGGIVKREVVRIVTPGLATEEQLLDDKSNRYLAAISGQERLWGLSFLDITTGEFLVTEHQESVAGQEGLIDELTRLAPAELLFDEAAAADLKDLLAAIGALLPGICFTARPAHNFHPETARQSLLEHFKTVNLAGFGCEHLPIGIIAAGALFQYMQATQKGDLAHIRQLAPLNPAEVLQIDEASRRNLELAQTIVAGRREGSLLAVLDYTCTPMGARLLKKQLLFPERQVDCIRDRLDAVEQFFKNTEEREAVREILNRVYDLERLNSRVVLGSANARDLTAIKQSLAQIAPLKRRLATLTDRPAGLLEQINSGLDDLADIAALIDCGIREDAPVTLRDGKIIKEGFRPELDELIVIQRDGKAMILALEAAERQKTGIANLKVGFNRVFGYYLEVSRAQVPKVPDHYIRKQTLVNGERYITPELKEFENKVMGAQEKRLELEYQLFCEIRQQIASRSSAILTMAGQIARIDFFACLAEAACRHRYVRPEINGGEEITISEGRHPVIERALPPGRFVPNDIHLDQQHHEVLIITGPNMAGKSTILRQTALIVLMAQMGGFVPADKATIGVVDRIFTRVGAMDDLRRGQSTFMVEMNETANILHNATEKSLVILDEIGRGTSTFDGLAIAWAVAEELADKNGKGVKTIFATHYHELTDLAATRNRVKNYSVAVREWNDTIIFLYKLLRGGANRSYGIQVAALAGVPARVVSRAHEILRNIENGEFNREGVPRLAAGRSAASAELTAARPRQLPLFGADPDPLRKKMQEVQPDCLAPIEALNLLYELKKL